MLQRKHQQTRSYVSLVTTNHSEREQKKTCREPNMLWIHSQESNTMYTHTSVSEPRCPLVRGGSTAPGNICTPTFRQIQPQLCFVHRRVMMTKSGETFSSCPFSGVHVQLLKNPQNLGELSWWSDPVWAAAPDSQQPPLNHPTAQWTPAVWRTPPEIERKMLLLWNTVEYKVTRQETVH